MAKIAVINWKKEQVGEVSVPAGVLDYPYRKHLVWEVVKAYRAGQRAGTHSTKVRSEVSGTGKKPFKQKGTGRARQGGGRPPIHRHGGISHGPKPRSYVQDVSVGEKKNALKAVLSRRFAEERIVVLDRMELDGHKTRDLKAAVDALGIQGKALFVDVDARDNENFSRASRNVRAWKLVDPLGVNTYDVLAHGTVVLTKSAFARVLKNLGGE